MPEGDGVPRETPSPSVVPESPVEVPVEAVARVFGDRADRAATYRELLATAGVERGLIGPREVPRLWDRHLLNCAYLGEVIDQGSSVIDLGSGAGLPGIPLALARPDLQIRLVEPLERRYTFLREAITELGLRDQVAVARGRAEDVRGEFSASVVTARAVAPLKTLYGWALPLVVTGGHLVAIKGRSASDEIAAAGETLRQMGVTAAPEVLSVGPDDGTGTTVVRVARGHGPLRAATAPAPPGAAKRRPGKGNRR
ncbi:16S rRNA (guanine(527)-N(7))-methyltransferase RsmG [Kineococcus radiotolerans]|uniref:Ribosomal RNA small subunit methyltransferase G n=1 Tax=Kineococcus radiotolerans (strain ATCC BAA-149 / DSM 14245 / SRS30216) TaxID=266940 RepID=RSMG_KINRD|nr:RecName: Full=Ribosomal RNA small subunit methyltransferase G; AltName: Full=16S rRNA 7-methylguanosine methyltransferase; Short=16S rRNA m7G methyltransferase [Kineococcus radiotolerans SRS30216 = ATCC BAA-149]ABS05967.1 methyltransferase GidB [Kineococcus radiotolerans SRS30216 = ATCC BAA-149]